MDITKKSFQGCPDSESFVKTFANRPDSEEFRRVFEDSFGFTYYKFLSLLLRKTGPGFMGMKHDYYCKAALRIYPHDRLLQYMLDRESPEELAKMVRGEYPLVGIKTRIYFSNKWLELTGSKFARAEDFLFSLPHKSQALNAFLESHFGFGYRGFCKIFGVGPIKGGISMMEQAAQVIYPGDKYLQYLTDRLQPAPVAKMIRGEYSLNGLRHKVEEGRFGYPNRMQSVELGHKTFPRLVDFISELELSVQTQRKFLKERDRALDYSYRELAPRILRNNFGLTYNAFCNIMLGQKLKRGSTYRITQFWEAMGKVYTSPDDQEIITQKIADAQARAARVKPKRK